MDRYLVIGNPIAHSRSPQIHQAFAQATQQAMSYECLLAPLDGFAQSVRQFFAEGGKGANITLPFKEQAFALADQLTEQAQAAGAVNTLKRQADGSILGDNTDGAGLVMDLQRLEVPLKDQRILLLGAGGAARGALAPLLEQQPKQLVIANRTLTKAQQLVQQFSALGHISAAEFTALEGRFDLIINATSASLAGANVPVPKHCLSAATHCYDMMYSAIDTQFNAWAKTCGAQHVHDGLGMLVAQAAKAFALWRGVLPPNLNQVLTELRNSL